MVYSDKPSAPTERDTRPPRTVFVSHSAADRKLAGALGALIDEAFSAVLGYFASSDPSPSGGLQPGDEWYAAIHGRLLTADSVWVLATEESITHPWLYWEAGIGRAICPRGVVVLRVGLTQQQIPSPLSAYQSYDGLSLGDPGIGTLIGKVANQLEMKIAPVLLNDCAGRWIEIAKMHKPDSGTGGQAVNPEQVDRIEGLIGRLEAQVQRVVQPSAFSSRLAELNPPAVGRTRQERRADLAARNQRTAEMTAAQTLRRETANRMFPNGRKPGFVKSAEELIAIVDSAPNIAFSAGQVDQDGDLTVRAVDGSENSASFWLRGEWVETLETLPEYSSRVSDLFAQIRARLAEDDA